MISKLPMQAQLIDEASNDLEPLITRLWEDLSASRHRAAGRLLSAWWKFASRGQAGGEIRALTGKRSAA